MTYLYIQIVKSAMTFIYVQRGETAEGPWTLHKNVLTKMKVPVYVPAT